MDRCVLCKGTQQPRVRVRFLRGAKPDNPRAEAQTEASSRPNRPYEPRSRCKPSGQLVGAEVNRTTPGRRQAPPLLTATPDGWYDRRGVSLLAPWGGGCGLCNNLYLTQRPLALAMLERAARPVSCNLDGPAGTRVIVHKRIHASAHFVAINRYHPCKLSPPSVPRPRVLTKSLDFPAKRLVATPTTTVTTTADQTHLAIFQIRQDMV